MHFTTGSYNVTSGAARYIACDCHAHLFSKAGSVISIKSPSPVFQTSRSEQQLIHRAVEHRQATQFALVITDDSPSIMNVISCSLSVNYGSVYLMPLHLKAADGDLLLITEPSLLTRCTWLSHAIYRAALQVNTFWGSHQIRWNKNMFIGPELEFLGAHIDNMSNICIFKLVV